MTKISRYFLASILAIVFSMLGCGVSTAPQTAPASYPVVAISDIHFNPFYDWSLYPALAAANAGQWETIFQNSAVKTPSTWGSDTNYPSMVLALAGVKQNLGASPMVLFSGDMLGHNIPELFCYAYSKLAPPAPPAKLNTCPPLDATGTAAMQRFMDNTVTFVSIQIRAAVGNVPVVFVPGNIDTYSVYGAGPDTTFLSDNENALYTQLLNGSIDRASFETTFTALGSYSTQPMGSNLLVVALNSNPFAAGSPTTPPLDPYAELTWLDSQLAAAQSAGQKVWLIMHVPPGANTTETAQIAAKAGTPSQTTDAEVAMMWQPQYQIEFMEILAKYPGLVTMAVTGHTHMDEFRVLPTGDLMYGIPGISPCFGNNPAFKIFTIARDTFMPMDYQSINYALGASPAPAQFTSLYTFSAAYSASPGSSLQTASQQLYPQLTPTGAGTPDFINYYDSGNTTLMAPSIPWNMAKPVNWPLYACGISQMDTQDYVNCVDTY